MDLVIQVASAQLEELRIQLASKQTALDEKDLIIAEKNRAILALEKDKQILLEEMKYVINGSFITLNEISEQVLDLTGHLEEFRLGHVKHGGKIRKAAPRVRHYTEVPTTLLSTAEHVSKKINDAKSALDEASKEWKRAEAVLEMMQSDARKRYLAKILGKVVPDAPPCKAEDIFSYLCSDEESGGKGHQRQI